jgi:uncharacterized protein YeaO (DUF488 family)
MRDVEIKRVYDAPAAADGYRVLVDRLWPRGITKERAHLCAWVKEVAPSTELRKWFSHDASRMHEFRNRYLHELRAARRPELTALAKTSERTRVTLLYAAHDPNINHAIVLQEAITSANFLLVTIRPLSLLTNRIRVACNERTQIRATKTEID